MPAPHHPESYDQPSDAGLDAPPPVTVTVARIRGYRPLHLDLRMPEGRERPVPLLIWIHGGAWWEGSRIGLPSTVAPVGFHQRILDRGYAVADVDYRLSAEATFPAQLHDVRAAVRWLRAFAPELGLDADRFAIGGESAGGHLAALAGLATAPELEGEIGVTGVSSAVQAVVDWYGPADLLAFQDDLPGEMPPGELDPAALLIGGPLTDNRDAARLASPVHHARPDAPPVLCVHGTDDLLVDYTHSEMLVAALRAQGARADLVPVPGAGHIFEGSSNVGALVDRSVDFLDDVFDSGQTRR